MAPPPENAQAPAIQVRSLQPADARAIRAWPPYTGAFAPLDYALREPGWLGLFPVSEHTRHLALGVGDRLVGFSLLVGQQDGRTEFYIALHPDWLGQGIGQRATRAVLHYGFSTLRLASIYLKVRAWHERGLHIYRKVGFVPQGEKQEEVDGVMERFVVMEITAESFSESAPD